MNIPKRIVSRATSRIEGSPANSGYRHLRLRGSEAGGMDISSLIVIIVVLIAIVAAIFFIVRAGNLKSELVQARKSSADEITQLQGQLNAANSRVGEASNQLARMEAQVGEARAEATTAKNNAEKSAGQAADLQKQLDIAKRLAMDAKASGDKSAAEVVKLKAQLQSLTPPASGTPPPATTKPAPMEKPSASQPASTGAKSLPLGTGFTKAPMLDGIALSLTNTSSVSLALTVRFSNATDSKDLPVTLDPGASKQVGWLGAWVLASGDNVQIMSPGFETIVKTAP